jgi:hypothetical protein
MKVAPRMSHHCADPGGLFGGDTFTWTSDQRRLRESGGYRSFCLLLDCNNDIPPLLTLSNPHTALTHPHLHPHHTHRFLLSFVLTGALLTLGPPGSSSYFHSHSNTYNMLLEGEKHWYLMPPFSFFGPVDGMSMAEWVKVSCSIGQGMPELIPPCGRCCSICRSVYESGE